MVLMVGFGPCIVSYMYNKGELRYEKEDTGKYYPLFRQWFDRE